MYNTFAILDNMIYHCWAWVNSESLRMTGTCPCVINKSKPSKGQKATEKHVKMGNQLFRVRSNKGGFKRGG